MIYKKDMKKLFDKYNLIIQKKCEEQIIKVKSPKDYYKIIEEARLEFEKIKIDNKTAKEYFSNIETMDELVLTFNMACECDEFIPISFFEVFKKFDNLNPIREIAFEANDIEKNALAIKILGKIQDELSIKLLINTIYKHSEEFIKEVARQSLIDIGKASLKEIDNKLSKVDDLDGDDFHLVIAMVEIDKNKKNIEVYNSLRNYFKKAVDKGVAARCLGEYGDPKAIVLLRNYLNNNLSTMEQELAYDIKGSIEMLGGRTDDIFTN